MYSPFHHLSGIAACAAALLATPALSASSLQAYASTAGGVSHLGAVGGGLSCSTYIADPQTAWFAQSMRFGLPTHGPGCRVETYTQLASASVGTRSAAVLTPAPINFGSVGDPRVFEGAAASRAGMGVLGVRAWNQYSGSTDGSTVLGSQAFALQTENMTFMVGIGAGTYRPTFTVDGSLFTSGRTDS